MKYNGYTAVNVQFCGAFCPEINEKENLVGALSTIKQHRTSLGGKAMKKIFVIMLALTLLFALSACGEKEIKGEIYNAGNVSALVPEGWMAFPTTDLFDEYEGEHNPNDFTIAKGAKTAFDLFSKSNLKITFTPSDVTMLPADKDWYDNTADVESFTTGDRTWKGFSGTSLDEKMIVIWTQEGAQLQVTIWPELGGSKLSLDDPEVLAILKSITVTE